MSAHGGEDSIDLNDLELQVRRRDKEKTGRVGTNQIVIECIGPILYTSCVVRRVCVCVCGVLCVLYGVRLCTQVKY